MTKAGDVISEYFRPSELDEALTLASQPNTIIVGGGTLASTAKGSSPITAVDLQELGLAGIESTSSGLTIGAMTTLQELVDNEDVPDALSDLARRDAPRSIRNAATLGGAIVSADAESELVAGLLALDATVSIASETSSQDVLIGSLLDDPSLIAGGLVTSITTPTSGTTAAERTGRTPMDRSIVAAVAHRSAAGDVRLAMSGVADRPVLVDPGRIDQLDPPSDFRGSSAYRKHLAAILADRAIARLTMGSVS